MACTLLWACASLQPCNWIYFQTRSAIKSVMRSLTLISSKIPMPRLLAVRRSKPYFPYEPLADLLVLITSHSLCVPTETVAKTGMILLAGEVTSRATVDYQKVVRDTIRQIGYDDSAKGGFDCFWILFTWILYLTLCGWAGTLPYQLNDFNIYTNSGLLAFKCIQCKD